MSTPRSALTLLVLLALVPTALATGPDAFRPLPVDWSDTVYVPAWSPDLPPPQAVVLRYQRWASAAGRAENVLAEPVGVVFTHRVRMELRLAGGRLLDLSTREGQETRMLEAFDGLEDFQGVSSTACSITGGETTTIVLVDPAEVAFFAGSAGEVPLTIAATGEAGFLGPNGLRQEVELRAGLRVTVQYLGTPE